MTTDTERFLAALFQPDDWIELRLLPSREQRWLQIRDGFDWLAWAQARNANGENVYFGANPRKEDGDSKNEGVACARILFIDIDDRSIKSRDAVLVRIGEANLPEPTVVTLTGGGAHVYWLLDEPNYDLDDWERRMRALIVRAGSDRGVHDPARIMRLPGFANCKYDDRPVCKMVVCEPERSYHLVEFPAPPTPRPKPRIEAVRGSLAEESRKFLEGELTPAVGDRRAFVFRVACDMHARGWDLDTATSLIMGAVARLNLDTEDEYDLRDRQIPNAFAKPRDPTYRGEKFLGAEIRTSTGGAVPAIVDTNTGEVRELSELALSHEYQRRFGADLMYDERKGGWIVWRKGRWHRAETDAGLTRARQLIEIVLAEVGAKKSDAVRLTRVANARSLDSIAKQDSAVSPASLDADDMLLGTPTGTVDLRSGLFREARREERITLTTAVDPADTPDCPRWLEFLRESMQGDDSMVAYLQRIAGYCLTGQTVEHALVFAHGSGGNGKSVWIGTLMEIMDQYATPAQMEVLCESGGDRHPTEIAALDGPRLVAAQEVGIGKAWNEARVKSLTGGDELKGRYMHRDFFKFRPRCKIVVAGNHQPRFRTIDDAVRRRMHLIPFMFRPERPDHQLREKLRDEWPAILRWAIDGALAWQESGLSRPEKVVSATEGYLSAEDHWGQWCEDTLEFGDPKGGATSRELVECWTRWSEQAGVERVLTPQVLREAIETRGGSYGYVGRQRGYRGVRVKTDWATLANPIPI